MENKSNFDEQIDIAGIITEITYVCEPHISEINLSDGLFSESNWESLKPLLEYMNQSRLNKDYSNERMQLEIQNLKRILSISSHELSRYDKIEILKMLERRDIYFKIRRKIIFNKEEDIVISSEEKGSLTQRLTDSDTLYINAPGVVYGTNTYNIESPPDNISIHLTQSLYHPLCGIVLDSRDSNSVRLHETIHFLDNYFGPFLADISHYTFLEKYELNDNGNVPQQKLNDLQIVLTRVIEKLFPEADVNTYNNLTSKGKVKQACSELLAFTFQAVAEGKNLNIVLDNLNEDQLEIFETIVNGFHQEVLEKTKEERTQNFFLFDFCCPKKVPALPKLFQLSEMVLNCVQTSKQKNNEVKKKRSARKDPMGIPLLEDGQNSDAWQKKEAKKTQGNTENYQNHR